MIGIVDRYVGRVVLVAILAVLIAFLALLSIFALIEELGENEPGYTFSNALTYIFLTLPRRTYELIPYVAFLGSLIGLGHLAANQELVALRAAGMSIVRLYRGLLWVLCIILVGGFLIGEYLAPQGEQIAETGKLKQQHGNEAIKLKEGYWYREDGMYMRVDAIDGQGVLWGVAQHKLDTDGELSYSRIARKAQHVPAQETTKAHWMLYDVVETMRQDGVLTTRKADRIIWNSDVQPSLLGVKVFIDANKLSVSDLFYQIDYMKREDLHAQRYQLAFWSKLLQPLSVIGLTLLAMVFVMGPLRSVSIGARLAAGILTGLVFKYFQDMFGPICVVYGLPAVIAVLIPIAICWIVAIIGIRKVQ
ncbi:MAG: LPS export ABC transporter permease LptG [Proteobacteria bacterium]|nr:LPS export ABC transporter permease LptG [Pseudomonadota bacterium]